MCFFIYALEELYAYHHNDSNGVFDSTFTGSEIVPGSFVFRDRNRINSIERPVFAIPVSDYY